VRADSRPAHWNEIEKALIPPNIDEFFRQSAVKYRDSVLLDFFEDHVQFTYVEFADLVSSVTGGLLDLAVQFGDRVAVMLPNVPEFPALMFALARLGAVMVPINPRYTSAELDFVAEDASVCCIITDVNTIRVLEGTRIYRRLGPARIIVVGQKSDEASGRSFSQWLTVARSVTIAPAIVDIDSLMSIHYTSGTTGLPKGCLLSHRYWLTSSMTYAGILGPRMRILEDLPWFYMTGPLFILQAMWHGGTQVIARRPSLSKHLKRLHEQHIDLCGFPKQLILQPPSSLDREHSLTHAWTSETTPAELEEIESRFGVSARELWAMTETGLGTFVPWEDREMAASGSIGIPTPFRECKIVDDALNEVSDGVAGELCIRGPGMFLGYHNRPEVNRSVFIDGRWFRTGDLARRNERGWYFYLGRIKDMIRRSGENIAAQEVEQVLEKMPDVAVAAVISVADDLRGQEVKAYVILTDGRGPDQVPPESIFRWCATQLAPFKIPRYLEYRESLPRTPSGKISKSTLKEERPDPRAGCYDRENFK
jgi:crotonobetaine/carnitine-CoA ligase